MRVATHGPQWSKRRETICITHYVGVGASERVIATKLTKDAQKCEKSLFSFQPFESFFSLARLHFFQFPLQQLKLIFCFPNISILRKKNSKRRHFKKKMDIFKPDCVRVRFKINLFRNFAIFGSNTKSFNLSPHLNS